MPTVCPEVDSSLPPRLWLSKTVWDFGQIWFGDPCEIDVEIRNVGGGSLEIRNVGSSCGCTAARPSKQALASGESDKIHITYNSRKGATNVSQTLTVETSDETRPRETITVRGTVKNVFDGKPMLNLGFGDLTSESVDERSIELTSNLDEPVNPTLEPLPPGTPFELKLETLEPGKRFKLTAKTVPPLKNPSSATATLKTGLTRFPTVTVPISAFISERVSIMPPAITILNTPQYQSTRVAQLKYLKTKPVTVKSITSNLPSVTASMNPAKITPINGMFDQQMINVTVPPYADLPAEGATITIETDDPDPKYAKLILRVNKAPDLRANPNAPTVPIKSPTKGGAPTPPPAPPTTQPAGGGKP